MFKYGLGGLILYPELDPFTAGFQGLVNRIEVAALFRQLKYSGVY